MCEQLISSESDFIDVNELESGSEKQLTAVGYLEQMSPWRPCVVVITRDEQLYIEASESVVSVL